MNTLYFSIMNGESSNSNVSVQSFNHPGDLVFVF
jgi:hypothetical protein